MSFFGMLQKEKQTQYNCAKQYGVNDSKRKVFYKEPFPLRYPRHYTIEIKKVQSTSTYGHQYVVKTQENESVLLQTSLESDFAVGHRFLVHGKLIPISPPKNPTDFDFKSYMRRKGISRKLLLTSQVFVPLQSKWSLKSWAFVERWKKTCKAKGVRFHATATQGAYPLNWCLKFFMYAVKSCWDLMFL